MAGWRMRMMLAAGIVLLLPGVAHAAGAQVRLLNAAVSGKITIAVDGKTEFSRVKLGRTTRRHGVRAGRHVITAQTGKGKAKRVIARLKVSLVSRERATIVYTLKGRRPSLFLFIEPAPVRGAIIFRAANFASAAGTVSVRIGSTVVAKRLRFGAVTPPRRLVPASSPTGVMKVSARRGKRAMTAHDPLVLATGSVGLFAIIPKGRKAKVVRLPYTTPVPTPTHQPKLIGTRRFGHTLRCTADGWRPKGVVVKKVWMVDGHLVGRGVSRTLTTAEDAGHKVACSVSATLHGMTTTAVVAFNLPGVPKILTLPSVKAPAGALKAGQIVTCDHGVWSNTPTTFAYRWFRKVNDVPIGTGRTYQLKLPADNGGANALGCDVIATNTGGVSPDVRSSNTIALGIAPTVKIDASSKPSNPTPTQTANFTWSIGGGGADTVQCKLDAAPFGPCTGTLTQSYGSAQLTTRASGSQHTFTVRVTNAVTTAQDSYTWTVNPQLPTVSFGVVPALLSGDTAPTLNWSAGGGGATGFTCKLDNGALHACGATNPPKETENGLAADPAGAPHSFTVTATNASGDSTPATYSWTIFSAPVLSNLATDAVDGGPAADVTLTFTVTGTTTSLTCQIDAQPVVDPCASGHVFTNPGLGLHTINVTATNVGGSDTQSPATWTFV